MRQTVREGRERGKIVRGCTVWFGKTYREIGERDGSDEKKSCACVCVRAYLYSLNIYLKLLYAQFFTIVPTLNNKALHTNYNKQKYCGTQYAFKQNKLAKFIFPVVIDERECVLSFVLMQTMRSTHVVKLSRASLDSSASLITHAA